MATQKAHLVTKRQQFARDAVDQRRMVPIGEIGTADGAAEQHVAHHRETQRR